MSKKLYLSALLLTLSILAFGLSNQTAVAEQIPDPIANLGNGNVTINLPENYDPNTPTPLILVLHGFGANGSEVESIFRFREKANDMGLIHMAPNGTYHPTTGNFWNATDACCGSISM